jgi:hypothetical protein
MSSEVLRLAFRVHAVYFFAWALFFESLPESLMRSMGLDLPQNPVSWIATSVAAGGLVTAGVLFWLASRHAQPPRIALGTALIQTGFNLYHDAVWLLAYWDRGQVWLVVLDTVVIASLFSVYFQSWRTSRARR